MNPDPRQATLNPLCRLRPPPPLSPPLGRQQGNGPNRGFQ
eukprot:CAMPEP_0114138796 /NCGR_PEP_ID=MMETSP0043_2-20121206/16519_1 /TAXON_ID=464988 /ORGANISM="Hemiselmis andersenii, Strain CCMP644" /LENGTH=39 /DNA_ID= /DNA_START= /DNA_END= /DNA_ORIENTATION=